MKKAVTIKTEKNQTLSSFDENALRSETLRIRNKLKTRIPNAIPNCQEEMEYFKNLVIKKKVLDEGLLNRCGRWTTTFQRWNDKLGDALDQLDAYKSRHNISSDPEPNTEGWKRLEAIHASEVLRKQRGVLWQLLTQKKLEQERLRRHTGHKLMTAINGRIDRTVSKIKKAVGQYNDIYDSLSEEVRSNVTRIDKWETAVNPDSEFWRQYIDQNLYPDVDPNIRDGIEALHSRDRAEEEIIRLEQEMRRMKEWVTEEITYIQNALNSDLSTLNCSVEGIKNLLRKENIRLGRMFSALSSLFSPYIEIENPTMVETLVDEEDDSEFYEEDGEDEDVNDSEYDED